MTEKELILVNKLGESKRKLENVIRDIKSSFSSIKVGLKFGYKYNIEHDDIIRKYPHIEREMERTAIKLLKEELDKINTEIKKYID